MTTTVMLITFMNLTKRNQRLLLVAITVIILGILVPISVVYNLKAGDRSSEQVAENSISPGDGVFEAQINVTSLSTVTQQANLHFVIKSPGQAFTLSGNSKSASFSPADFNPEADLTFAVVEATSNKYPFDHYVIAGTFVFRNQNGNTTFPSNVIMDASVDSWRLVDSALFDVGSAEDSDPENKKFVNTVAVYLEYRRSPVLITFSIFLGLLMWLLSLSAFTMASLIWLRGRKVEPPTIAVVGALLFALPAMRNVQPGAPAVGCAFDFASFFWALLLIAISLILLMWNYIFKYKSEKPAVVPGSKVDEITITTA